MNENTENTTERYEFLSSECLSNPKIDIFTYHSLRQVWRHIEGQFLILQKWNMKFEILRYATLLSYSRDDKPDIITIAAAGFYYSCNTESVVCFICGLSVSCLKKTDEPIIIHKQISPTCEFFSRNGVVNKRFFVPKRIEVDLIGEFEQGDLHAQEETQNGSSVQPEIQQPQELNHQTQHEESVQHNEERQAEQLAVPNIILRSNDERNGEGMTAESLQVHLRDSLLNASLENGIENLMGLLADSNQISSDISIEQLNTRTDCSVANSDQSLRQHTNNSNSYNSYFTIDSNVSPVMSHNPSDTVSTFREMSMQLQQEIDIETGFINKQSNYPRIHLEEGINLLPDFLDMTFRKRNISSIASNNLQEQVTRFFSADQYMYMIRLDTFQNWPADNLMIPEHLADAGLLYTGAHDRVQCNTCDVVLQEWKNDDDPWIEHARHSPECSYVLKEFGRALPMALKQNNQEDVKCYKELFVNRRGRLYVRAQSEKAVRPISLVLTYDDHDESEGCNMQCHVCSRQAYTRSLLCEHVICEDCIVEEICPICGKNRESE